MDFSTVDQTIWQHPVMRRASENAGRLFFYLVTCARDCEGRFLAHAFDLLEGCWSRAHDVDEQDVEDALQELADIGVVILYQDGRNRYGFLLGWYEHQRVDAKWRDGSSLPPPPVRISSWDRLDILRRKYADFAELDAKRTSRKAAIAWFRELPDEQQEALLPRGVALQGRLAVGEELAQTGAQVGADSVVSSSCSSNCSREVVVPRDGPWNYGAQNGVRNDLGALKGNNPHLSAACHALSFSPPYPDRWFDDLLAAVENQADFLRDERHACEMLKKYQPKVTEKALPAKWLERLEKAEGAATPAPESVVKRYPVEKLQQMREDDVGLLSDNTRVTWGTPGNVLVAQLEEAHR